MDKFYFTYSNGKLSYAAKKVFETDSFLVLAECDSSNLSLSLCELIYKNKELPGKVQSVVDGMFTLVLFDKVEKGIHLFQDKFSYIAPLYYYATPTFFACSLSMNTLLHLIERPFEFNYKSVPEFLYSGFICLNDTLIKDIYKLPPLHQVKVTGGVVKDITYTPLLMKHQPFLGYEDAFESAVLKCVDPNAPIANITLSGGYDSNFLLHILKRHGLNVHAFTGGGVVGVDESSVAKKICKLYESVEHSTIMVDSEVLDIYPRIIMANEGALYERGIFLHYLMGEELDRNNVSCTLSGDGADQVLSGNFRYAVSEYKNIGKVPHNPWESNPFEMLAYIAVKKTGIFLRKHNIQPNFPFINSDFLCFAENRKINNGTAKDEYKKHLSQIIKPEVYNLLNRCGGSTSLKPIFKNKNTYTKYREIVERSELYRYLPPQPDRYGREENEFDITLKMLYLMLFKKMYTGGKSMDYLYNHNCKLTIDDVLGV